MKRAFTVICCSEIGKVAIIEITSFLFFIKFRFLIKGFQCFFGRKAKIIYSRYQKHITMEKYPCAKLNENLSKLQSEQKS
jgi:hypothetical protein